MGIKNIILLLSAIMLIVLFSGTALALNSSDITNIKVEANDVELSTTSPKSLEKTDEIDVLVVFDSNVNTSNLQVEVVLRGADLRDPVEDITEVFDVRSGNRYDKRLELKLPIKLEQGRYDLKVRFDDRTGSSLERAYPLDVGSFRHSIEIKDIVTNPEDEVDAGRALLVSVRVKNRGESKEEDIKIKASIPVLGISASDFIDELDKEGGDDDSATSEEMFLRIPNNAKTGDYSLKVEVEFKDGEKSVTRTTTIKVKGEEAVTVPTVPTEKPEAKTVIAIGPESQDVSRGGSAIYALTITNLAQESRSFTIDVNSANWAVFKVSPSNVIVINKGESKALTVQVNPKDTAPLGEQMFAVTVKSGDAVLKQVALKANIIGREVTPSTWDNVKRSIEIGLVILVVVLVILALVIGFSKLRGEEEKPKEEQTYY